MDAQLWKSLALVAAWAAAMPAGAQTAPTRGRLLYDTHCTACHDAKMHWRDNKLASNWASLRALVRQWQGNAQLQWSDSDIDEVTRYLNDAIYRFSRPPQPIG